ncbi:unnamed protein product [Brugia timori]|uniref:Dynein light chain n=1 Tax=Brugia timori TaxID=42155 RepID=A0A0R3QJJ9_9BILA|nr:unnamed protein product [Brugia timori]
MSVDNFTKGSEVQDRYIQSLPKEAFNRTHNINFEAEHRFELPKVSSTAFSTLIKQRIASVPIALPHHTSRCSILQLLSRVFPCLKIQLSSSVIGAIREFTVDVFRHCCVCLLCPFP